jgi:hypothetical protein
MIAHGINGQFNLQLPYASEMYGFASSIMGSVNSSYQAQLTDISKDIAKLMTTSTTELKTLQEELDALTPNNEFLSDWVRYESVNDFLSRSTMINSGPMLVSGFSQKWVDLALQLPKTSV